MKTLQRTNLNEIPDGLKHQILERFGHALHMYDIPFDSKVGLQEFQRIVTKYNLEVEEFRTAKIINKVASNIRTSSEEAILVYHLSTLCDKSLCHENAPTFDKSLLDSGYNPELLFGGKICKDGKYTQVAGYSFLTSESHTELYSPIGIAAEEISTPILKSLLENKKRIISASGRLQEGTLWCVISDVVVNMDNAHYGHYYAAAVEIQSMINKSNFSVIDAEQGKKMFSNMGLSEKRLLDLYDTYMDYVDSFELGDVVSHSMMFRSLPIMKITCDIYDQECTFFFLPDSNPECPEEASYTTVWFDSLPETSALKYLTKLF